jgi:hypothetical protein
MAWCTRAAIEGLVALGAAAPNLKTLAMRLSELSNRRKEVVNESSSPGGSQSSE